ncbi:hypothetical protein LTR20_007166 [Exophiala xenobiotica]|nr:hypothetical protein LTS13_003252 [Exophiala xenobiotica]KAK5393063.1 hypothetical protein LTR79_009376 [Exophiala xenobiotica]KAK5412168.1 hypothetical protein LTR90_007731 [Exophiala xenobiotica]KAK5460739.1 hypothetical protein LTR20_007166 [Exophiala xenobiotica]KAK5481423.1 hypothetical protein LTR26_007260 [Exophiala xenobiotica]
MDAAEQDLDAKLYKASGTLLEEIKHKLPLLIYHTNRSPRTHRLFVLDPKCQELSLLLDRFQEWPQLLDHHLSDLVQLLANAFVDYLTTSSEHYSPTRRSSYSGILPLPRAICRLLYSFCKVRGYKVIVRLLNNEPKYLGLMLASFKAWSTASLRMTWEERYVMLLWLSHLMLAPFELASMSLGNAYADVTMPDVLSGLPTTVENVISLALGQLESSGKEREAASVLLVRLSLRNDMQAHDLASKLVAFASRGLLLDEDLLKTSPYKSHGLLALLYGITNASSDSEAAPFIEKLFTDVLKLATSKQKSHTTVRDSAPARKWILKIMRVVVTHAISLNATRHTVADETLTMMLEESIQYFLDALNDKDTPVRMAAAKALSLITLRLENAMSREVVEAILGSLEESVLLEDLQTQELIPLTDKTKSSTVGLKRNISAVDPLKWHGLMLTLGHLVFRRSPPPDILPEIIQAMILGLEFEQRSNVGTSVGVGVRDAACFGLWALARKYSTTELGLVHVSNFAEAALDEYADCKNVLQLIAIKLTISACFDPSGNIRRGSSAALQELIGRHPDTIMHGIPVVQIVDYHAVARLSRAMIEVAPQAAALDRIYQRPILQAMIGWRGARATDLNQRRWAASAVGILTRSSAAEDVLSLLNVILRQLSEMRTANIGSTAAARHGLLLIMMSALESAAQCHGGAMTSWFQKQGQSLFTFSQLTGKMDGRMTADLELVMEGISALVGSICRSLQLIGVDKTVLQQDWTSSALDILNQCTVAGTKDAVVETSSKAYLDMFKLLPSPTAVALVEKWLDINNQPLSAFTSKGRIRTLSLIHAHLAGAGLYLNLQQAITAYTIGIVKGNFSIETRIDAMGALSVILLNSDISTPSDALRISDVLCCGLNDYTNDQRGDIGSTLRLQSIETLDAFRNHVDLNRFSDDVLPAVMPFVAKLAAEKLNSVRFRAWKCLEGYWKTNPGLPTMQCTFDYPADVSSISYFQQLLELFPIKDFQQQLLLGLVSSTTSGTEDVCRAASNAFLSYMQLLDNDRRNDLAKAAASIILRQLDENATQDDRQVVILLDFLCFLMDQNLLLNDSWDIWAIMQKIQGPTSSLQRIEAALNCYSRLLSIDEYRARAMDKLTRQLLHRWPKVRNDAADLLYFEFSNSALASFDWNAPVTKTKPIVLELRKQLGIAGVATPK